MSDYPEKTCSIDRLVTQEKLVQAALAGRKTQQRRNGIYAYPGEKFELGGITFEVTRVVRETLAQMGDAEAQAEGFPSLEAYKQIILRMHQGMGWDPEAKVWLHEFKRVG